MKLSRLMALALASSSLVASSAALAQTRTVEGDSAEPNDILVTARKREERLSDVPIAISAFTGNQLQERGVSNMFDLVSQSPGVLIRQDVAGRASPSIVIRGIGYDDFRSNGNPAVAVHADQVYLGSNALIGGNLFDIDRVEILKGPQGTLYGRNTTAGAVNIVSRQPGNDLEANAYVEGGSYRHVRAEAGVGGPLSDTVGLRVAATYERGGGFMINKGTEGYAGKSPSVAVPLLPLVPESDHVGDADFFAARGTLVFEPSTATKLTFQLTHARDLGENSQSDVLGTSATGFTEPDTDPFTYYGTFVPRIHSDQTGGQMRLEQDLGFARLTAIGAYIDLDRRYTFDPGDPRRTFDLDYRDRLKQYTGEVRLQGGVGTLVDWTLGGFYFRDRIRLKSRLDASDQIRTVLATNYLQHRESYAVFGEADWHITQSLTLTTGLRYNDETSDFSGTTYDLNPYGASVASSAFRLPVVFDQDFSDNNVSGRIVLSYRPAEQALLYASYSRGFKSGGFDGSTIFSAPEAAPFRSEKVNAYEAGAKLFASNVPVTISAAGFYYDFSNLQANSVRSFAGITTAVRTNVAKASLYGGEVEIVATPLHGARIGMGVSYLHSKVDDFISSNPLEVARRDGNELPDAPGLTLNLDASYAFNVGRWKLEPQANFRFTGDHYKEIDNYVPVRGYGLLNLRLALTSPDGRWTAAVFGRNVTDTRYFTGLIPAASAAGVVSGTQRIMGAPDTYGLSLGLKY
jgi:iron complex outermembrane recepter protein